mgnify:CR=1 FL=1
MTMTLPGFLQKKIMNVAPLKGVSIRDEADRSTWLLHFEDHASADQKDKADVILKSFDLNEYEINCFQELIDKERERRISNGFIFDGRTYQCND